MKLSLGSYTHLNRFGLPSNSYICLKQMLKNCIPIYVNCTEKVWACTGFHYPWIPCCTRYLPYPCPLSIEKDQLYYILCPVYTRLEVPCLLMCESIDFYQHLFTVWLRFGSVKNHLVPDGEVSCKLWSIAVRG